MDPEALSSEQDSQSSVSASQHVERNPLDIDEVTDSRFTSASASEKGSDKRGPPPRSPYKTHARLASQVDDSEQESASRKREREGSLEPSGSTGTRTGAVASLNASGLPSKKNKLIEEDEHESSRTDSQLSNTSAKEGEKVGQIRQRVQDLTWQERKKQEESVHIGEEEDDYESMKVTTTQSGEASEPISDVTPESAVAVALPAQEAPAKTPVRSQPTFSSFSSKPSPFAAAAAASGASSPFASAGQSADKRGNASPFHPTKLSSVDTTSLPSPFAPTKLEIPDQTSSPSETAASPPPAQTTTSAQPTFSSFSSSSSPFASSSSAAGPSWLASGGGAGSGSGTGLTPTSLGSSHGRANRSSSPASKSPSTEPAAAITPPSKAPSATSAGKAKASSLGFGAFAGAAKFGGSSSSNGSTSPARHGTQSPTSDDSKGASWKEAKDFAEALAESHEAKDVEDPDEDTGSGGPVSLTGGVGKGKGKSSVQETDVVTGEESERTVYSARAKLYVMGSDEAWKERGTGTVRCNVPKKSLIASQSAANTARLVMRADGVFRVILNVPLFAGMSLELAQERFIRLVALEEGKLVHFTLKLSNAAAATAFLESVGREIPSKPKAVAS